MTNEHATATTLSDAPPVHRLPVDAQLAATGEALVSTVGNWNDPEYRLILAPSCAVVGDDTPVRLVDLTPATGSQADWRGTVAELEAENIDEPLTTMRADLAAQGFHVAGGGAGCPFRVELASEVEA